jgi:hypothetical protein
VHEADAPAEEARGLELRHQILHPPAGAAHQHQRRRREALGEQQPPGLEQGEVVLARLDGAHAEHELPPAQVGEARGPVLRPRRGAGIHPVREGHGADGQGGRAETGQRRLQLPRRPGADGQREIPQPRALGEALAIGAHRALAGVFGVGDGDQVIDQHADADARRAQPGQRRRRPRPEPEGAEDQEAPRAGQMGGPGAVHRLCDELARALYVVPLGEAVGEQGAQIRGLDGPERAHALGEEDEARAGARLRVVQDPLGEAELHALDAGGAARLLQQVQQVRHVVEVGAAGRALLRRGAGDAAQELPVAAVGQAREGALRGGARGLPVMRGEQRLGQRAPGGGILGARLGGGAQRGELGRLGRGGGRARGREMDRRDRTRGQQGAQLLGRMVHGRELGRELIGADRLLQPAHELQHMAQMQRRVMVARGERHGLAIGRLRRLETPGLLLGMAELHPDGRIGRMGLEVAAVMGGRLLPAARVARAVAQQAGARRGAAEATEQPGDHRPCPARAARCRRMPPAPEMAGPLAPTHGFEAARRRVKRRWARGPPLPRARSRAPVRPSPPG